MNKEVMFSSATDNWATPQDFLKNLMPSFISILMYVQMNLTTNAINITRKNKMDWLYHGKELCGVIHLMAERLGRGCAGHYLLLLLAPQL